MSVSRLGINTANGQNKVCARTTVPIVILISGITTRSADTVKYSIKVTTPLAVPSQIPGGVSPMQGSGSLLRQFNREEVNVGQSKSQREYTWSGL